MPVAWQFLLLCIIVDNLINNIIGFFPLWNISASGYLMSGNCYLPGWPQWTGKEGWYNYDASLISIKTSQGHPLSPLIHSQIHLLLLTTASHLLDSSNMVFCGAFLPVFTNWNYLEAQSVSQSVSYEWVLSSPTSELLLPCPRWRVSSHCIGFQSSRTVGVLARIHMWKVFWKLNLIKTSSELHTWYLVQYWGLTVWFCYASSCTM